MIIEIRVITDDTMRSFLLLRIHNISCECLDNIGDPPVDSLTAIAAKNRTTNAQIVFPGNRDTSFSPTFSRSY